MIRFYFFIFIGYLICATTLHAAILSVNTAQNVAVGDQIEVDIVALTDGQPINSAEISVAYPDELLTFVGYQDGAGIIKLWIVPPRVTQEGIVSFAGGVPGGVSGTYSQEGRSESVPIVRLLFLAKEIGNAEIKIQDSSLLLNDGKGTTLSHDRNQKTVFISNQNEAPSVSRSDSIPPLPFSVVLLERNRESGTPQMLSFSAYDEESGIASYRVKAGFLGRWKEATSPYPISKPFISYTAKVKAIDGYGNEQIARIAVKGAISWWIFLIVVLVGAGLYKRFMIKNKI